MRTLPTLLGFALATGIAAAQAPTPKIEFEVASIRPFDPSPGQTPDQVTAGLHVDGAQVRAVGLSLRDYMGIAFELKPGQVSGPEWIASERFNVSAKFPEGGKPEQLRDMMRSLLEDRFGLKYHKESKEFPVYFLDAAKGGARLTESPLNPVSDDPDEAKKGFTAAGTGGRNGISVDIGRGASYSFANNRFEAKKISMDQAAGILASFMDRRIVDRTSLTKTYDFAFDLTPEDYRVMLIHAGVNAGVTLPPEALRLLDLPSGDSLAIAMEKLGLKLTPGKAAFDVYVVDQATKTPSAN